MSVLVTRDVHKTFGTQPVLNGVSFTADKSEVIAIIGPSGSGKSTFLRTLNGLEKVDRGSIKVLGRDVANATDLSRIRGKVGFVFQGFNLFSHLTILQNVMLAPIRVLKLKRAEAERLALQLLSRVGIAEHAGKYPSQISGGQQQRAAIARTLALQPEIVLFDEPTSALDPEMTAEVLDVLRELAKSGLTMLVVTHEMGFAREVASRIVFFDQGKIVADDQPRAFFENSENPRLKLFLSRILKH